MATTRPHEREPEPETPTEKQRNESLRLEALRLAKNDSLTHDAVLEVAEAFYNFLKGTPQNG